MALKRPSSLMAAIALEICSAIPRSSPLEPASHMRCSPMGLPSFKGASSGTAVCPALQAQRASSVVVNQASARPLASIRGIFPDDTGSTLPNP